MIEVHRATAADAHEVASALSDIYHCDVAAGSRFAEVLDNKDFVLLVAKRGSRTIGYIHAQILDRIDGERMMLIYDLEVHEAERRRGAGTALLEECLDIAAAQGVSRTWLITEPENEPARAFYTTTGGTQWPTAGFRFDKDPR